MINHVSEPPASADIQGGFIIARRNASILHFLRDPVGFFRSVSEHGKSLSEISLGKRNFYVVSDPVIIRDILSTRGALFEKFPPGNPKQKLFGGGLLTSEGAAQKQQRRMLLPGFHRERLEAYAHQMVACVERLNSSWPSGARLDVAHEMNGLTLEIIGRTLLGVNDRALMSELGAHLHTMLNLANRFVVPWGDWLMNVPLPSTIRYGRAVASLDEIVFGLIKKARQQDSSNDLVGMLLASSLPDGRALTDSEIRDEIVTMIVAGHETVAVGLTWSLFLFSQHPELQDELARRVIDILGGRDPEPADYRSLEFLQHAFAEALRLYPPIWILGRRNLDDYTFRDFHAPKGSVFLVCMADLHRRASFFKDPDSFQPARWVTPEWPAYAYIPFGGGERRCLGERFAWMEGVFVLACLLKRWRFTKRETTLPKAAAKLTLHPRGAIWLHISKREIGPAASDANRAQDRT